MVSVFKADTKAASASTYGSFLQGKKQLSVLHLVPNSHKALNDFEFAMAFLQSLLSFSSRSNS